jgi:hypothetical protein
VLAQALPHRRTGRTSSDSLRTWPSTSPPTSSADVHPARHGRRGAGTRRRRPRRLWLEVTETALPPAVLRRPARPARAGRQARDRRLRHRLVIDLPARRVPLGPAQDRPELRQRLLPRATATHNGSSARRSPWPTTSDDHRRRRRRNPPSSSGSPSSGATTSRATCSAAPSPHPTRSPTSPRTGVDRTWIDDHSGITRDRCRVAGS